MRMEFGPVLCVFLAKIHEYGEALDQRGTKEMRTKNPKFQVLTHTRAFRFFRRLSLISMSSPRVIVQIFLTGSRILGKAFLEAGRQAVKNAKHLPQAGMASDVAGVGNANSGSATDSLTREHRMTLDEAQLILNVKRDEKLEAIMRNYEHLFKANSPPAPKAEENGKPPIGKQQPVAQSHYLQSKVQRALFRLEAERKAAADSAVQPQSPTQPNTQPQPPSDSQS